MDILKSIQKVLLKMSKMKYLDLWEAKKSKKQKVDEVFLFCSPFNFNFWEKSRISFKNVWELGSQVSNFLHVWITTT